MGQRLRFYEPDVVYESTQSTVDRRYLFKPNHRPDNELLHLCCDADALDLRNDKIPIPSTINIIGASYARAQRQVEGVRLHAAECNITHNHPLFSFRNGCHEEAATMFQTANSLIARNINKLYAREGPLFAERARVTPCKSEANAEEKILYALTNAVKDGLASTVKESPFFSTYPFHALGEEPRFWYYDATAYHQNGGARNRDHCLKDYIEWITLDVAPLPHQADWPEHRRQTWFRQRVREIEEEQRENRLLIGMPPATVESLYARSWEDRPKSPRNSGPQPICHCDDPKIAREYKKKRREVMKAHRKASIEYRAGNFSVEFPQGTFRPVIVRMLKNTAIKAAEYELDLPPPDD